LGCELRGSAAVIYMTDFGAVSLIPVRPDEGRLTELTAATQPGRRELVFMSPSRPLLRL